jgi:hypothetical protein
VNKLLSEFYKEKEKYLNQVVTSFPAVRILFVALNLFIDVVLEQ